MAASNPYLAYKQTQTTTAGQIQLIVMLHDGAIRNIAKAAQAMGKRDYETKGQCFAKAFQIIEHLWGTLNKDEPGDLTENLERIYSYVHARLMQANLHDDFGPLKEVMEHLRGLRESWAAVDVELKSRRESVLKPALDEVHEEMEIAA